MKRKEFFQPTCFESKSPPRTIYVSHAVMYLCDPTDCSLPGSSVQGILQTRILDWAAIPFSRESFWPRDRTHISHIGRQIRHHWATRKANKGGKYLAFFLRWVTQLSDTLDKQGSLVTSPGSWVPGLEDRRNSRLCATQQWACTVALKCVKAF